MSRKFKHILLTLISILSAISCLEEMEVAQPKPDGCDETVIVPRVKGFTNQYITKAAYAENETKITSLALLVFNSEGDLVHLAEISDDAGVSSITLNKSLLNSPDQRAKLTSSTVMMIANANLDRIKKSDGTTLKANKSTLTLAEMENYTIHFNDEETVVTSITDVTSITESFKGFPMIGNKTGVNLNSTSTQQDPVEVSLKILYAKMNFAISVDAGTENEPYEGVNPAFELSNYSVFNASKATTIAIPEEGEATASASYAYTATGAAGTASGKTTLEGRTPVKFTFYVAESRYNHNSDLKGIYPDDNWLASSDDDDVKGYSEMSDKDKAKPENQLNGVKYFYDDLIQQYKPRLATQSRNGTPAAGLATYVLISGVYTDYRGTLWDVNYKVYLGKDNAHNFHVDRNSEYTNKITIRGIRNNDSHSDGEVWMDHRVDVTLNEDSPNEFADCIAITRETLIDSHFEVRPLRVQVPENTIALLFLPRYNGAQIDETENGEDENWIAIENNNGRVKDITRFSPNGKRKYFTTSLIKELHLENNDDRYGIKINNNSKDTQRKGQKCIQLMKDDDGNDPCAWIYIDQNISENTREAEIELVFYDTQGDEIASETFDIIQSGLNNVGGFLIEKYEEYLHTYDSQDLYTNPLTDYTQQGYKWGLTGKTLSYNQNVTSLLVGNKDYYYDYFHPIDKQNVKTQLTNNEYNVLGVSDINVNHGLNFTNNAGVSQEMTIIDMNTRPESAIQYCLSKNKFKVDESDNEQHTMDIHWYLPDTYEMIEILTAGKNEFPDFAEYSYWTSQPSWSSVLAGTYLTEDAENARSVSLAAKETENYTGTVTSRNTQQRIRCAYSETGLPGVSFAGNRAPEGIGAMRFYMRTWKDWMSKEKGYFYDDWIKTIKATEPTPIGGYTEPDMYAYPKLAEDDPTNVFGGYKEGYGFVKDPSNPENQKPEIIDETLNDYNNYTIFHNWPGLTKYKVVEKTTLRGVTYYDLGEEKIETKGTENKTYIEYDGDITIGGLKPLDHLHHDRGDLSIAFLKGSDAANSPIYEYYKDSTINSSTTSRAWLPPTYKINYEVSNNDYSLRTPGGQIKLSESEQTQYDAQQNYTVTIFGQTIGYKKSRKTDDTGYIYASEAEAITAGNVATQATDETGEIVTIPTDVIRHVTCEKMDNIVLYSYYVKSGPVYNPKYTETKVTGTRYRYRIKYTIQGDKTPYYDYEKEGKWSETSQYSSETVSTTPTKDALRMYGGNSFTLTANNGNVISSVKIYFSDSNVVDERGTGRDYLRFTKDGFTGNENEEAPEMSYSANGNTGTMTWSGDAVNEITFKLVVYREKHSLLDIFGWLGSTGFQYIGNTDDSKSHSIVVDQIDVRYKKAESTD